MKVCLISPSSDNKMSDATKSKITRYKYYTDLNGLQHLGLGYLSSVLEQDGHEVYYLEMYLSSLSINDVVEIIINNNIKAIGITTFFSTMKVLVQLVNRIKMKYPNLFIFVGGYLATLSSELLLKLPIDCCVIGEGENTTRELINAIQQNEDWHNIDGLAYKSNNIVLFTQKRKLIKDLDILPFPKRIFPENFFKIASVLTSRGCYGKCTFCNISEFYTRCIGTSVRRRKPEKVVEEIKMLIDKYGVKTIRFNDDNFPISTNDDIIWFEEFYNLIQKFNVKVSFFCSFRANEIVASPDIIKKYVDIGLDDIDVGVESFVKTQLKFYNKGTTVEQNIEALKIISELNINFSFGHPIFDPRSSIDEIYEYICQIRKLDFLLNAQCIIKPLSINCCIVASEGTPMRNFVEKNNIYEQNERCYNFIHSEVDLCYKSINKWVEMINPIVDLRYLYFVAMETGDLTICEKIKKTFRKLFLLDLNVFEDIIYFIKNGDSLEIILKMINNSYGSQLNEIVNEMDYVQKILNI